MTFREKRLASPLHCAVYRSQISDLKPSIKIREIYRNGHIKFILFNLQLSSTRMYIVNIKKFEPKYPNIKFTQFLNLSYGSFPQEAPRFLFEYSFDTTTQSTIYTKYRLHIDANVDKYRFLKILKYTAKLYLKYYIYTLSLN